MAKKPPVKPRTRFENGVVVPRPRMAKLISTVTGIPLEKVLGLS